MLLFMYMCKCSISREFHANGVSPFKVFTPEFMRFGVLYEGESHSDRAFRRGRRDSSSHRQPHLDPHPIGNEREQGAA